MNEFQLIKEIVSTLGDRAAGDWVSVGPGDDCSVVTLSPDCEVVSSIDSLVSGVHFPTDAAAELVGYRSLLVSLSDVSAMGADPRYVLINLSLPSGYEQWALDCARGMKNAAIDNHIYVCGGNLNKGNLSITVSAHGEVPLGKSVLRSGAQSGDSVFVSGKLGGAASYIRRLAELTPGLADYETLKNAFYQPTSCVGITREVRNKATACIDISDGLMQDLQHVLSSSSVGAKLFSKEIPLCEGSKLSDALYGGDDYQLLCTSPRAMPDFFRIGEITRGEGILLDDVALAGRGYNHFEI